MRLQAQDNFSDRLDDIVAEAATRIVIIAYRYRIAPENFKFSTNKALSREVDKVMAWLREQIEELCEEYSQASADVAGDDDRSWILWWLALPSFGKTLRQRIATYCTRLKGEIESFCAAGLNLGLDRNSVILNIRLNIKEPYAQTSIVTKAGRNATYHSMLQHYGRGSLTSAYQSLLRLGKMTIALAWSEEQKHMAQKHGREGYIVLRGSSYPCDTCAGIANRFYPITDTDHLPPFHANCRCYVVYGDENFLLSNPNLNSFS